LIENAPAACRADLRAGFEAMCSKDFATALTRLAAADMLSGNTPEVPYCMALLYVQCGMTTIALSYFIEALSREPLLFACQRDFVATLKEVEVIYRPLLTDKLRQVLIACFRTQGLNHQLLLPFTLALIRLEEGGLYDDPLVHLLLTNCYLTDLQAERSFTQCRRNLLLSGETGNQALAIALAAQGRNNGFIWAVSAEEQTLLRSLRRRTDPAARLLLSMYTDLPKQPSAQIVRATRVKDPVSKKVQRQYDRFPYPAWTDLLLPSPEPPDRHPRSDILVAGCGTGRHALYLAARFPGIVVDAEDLSLRSLQYAAAKAKNFGLSNIRFMQADILERGAADKQYAWIECVGTLHHTRAPLKALSRLRDRLLPRGLMKLGLYSRKARAFIERVKVVHLNGNRAVSSVQEIRACRQQLLSCPPDQDLDRVFRLNDFYYTSGVKDLLFHEMESDFSLPEIRQMLQRLGISFLGFEVSPKIAAAFHQLFPASAGNDLGEWDEFEQHHPDSFLEMYVFWCQDNRTQQLC
jgi:SAM-dependent methyltransferase